MMQATAIAEEFQQYAYSVSHDLSAPVRAMVEFSRLLTDEHAAELHGDSKTYLDIIVENGRKMQTMMDGLLQYSRLNTMATPFSPIHTQEVVKTCCSILADTIATSKAHIHMDAMPEVYADASQLQKLFCVLIENAVKFHPAGNMPQVRITADKIADAWQFSVADNGIGVAPAHRESIFHLFKRLHTDEEYPGVGMGLTIAKKIVERHNGSISCHANQPNGSVFIFTLPVMEATS